MHFILPDQVNLDHCPAFGNSKMTIV